MTDISSYYHNLKLGPVGMLEVGGKPCDGIGSSWGVEFRSRMDQRARLPLYLYILPKILYKCEIMQSGCKVVKVPTLTTIKVARLDFLGLIPPKFEH